MEIDAIPLNTYVEVECLSGRKYITKFTSDFEKKHVIQKWKIINYTVNLQNEKEIKKYPQDNEVDK